MNLNLFNNLTNSIKENEIIQNFIKELQEFLENPTLKDNSNKTEEIGILEKIQSERNTSIANKNRMNIIMDDVLMQYANNTINSGDLYFVAGKSSKIENTYIVYKYENGKDSIINISVKELPQNAGINSVLRVKNRQYVFDEKATNDLIKKITQMANDLLDKQNKTLNEYRKDGHIYMVTEKINDSVFLWDTTDKPDKEIEEVDFPKELKDKATEGTVFIYTGGKYEFFSNYGFERI